MPRKFLTIFSLIFILAACEKEEKKYPLIQPSAKTFTQTISMGENYENQVYFQFSTQRMASNAHDKWGLGFSRDWTNKIILNGGKNSNMSIAIIPNGDFVNTTSIDPKTLNWRFDNPDGNIDSTAIGNWSRPIFTNVYECKNNNLYILDRGDENLGDKRYVKFKLIGRDFQQYTIQWNYLSQTGVTNTYIDVDHNYDRNFIYYCFNQPPDTLVQTYFNNEALPNNEWDIVFTTYKKAIPDGTGKLLPYLLRGVLLNPRNTQAVDVSNYTNYDAIDLAFAKKQTYTNRLDVIGYDWKVWSLSANKYTIDQKKVYIIIDHKGNYYKLKFVDFYDDQGRKGYPKMAWEILN